MGVPPYPPTTRMYVPLIGACWRCWLSLFSIAAQKSDILLFAKIAPKIFLTYKECQHALIILGATRHIVKDLISDFFRKPPTHHGIRVGDLVTCTCHGGVAIVVELFDEPSSIDRFYHPKMNMARIWWIKVLISTADGVGEQRRSSMHTIDRLNRFNKHH